MSENELITVTVSRTYAQSAEQVFDAWLDARLLRRFLFATADGEVVKCDVEPRPGGRFVIVDRRPEGDVAHVGRFQEIERPARLGFEFAVPAISPDLDAVVLAFTSLGCGCEVVLTCSMQPQWADYVDQSREGWSTILGTLGSVLDDR